MDLYALITLIRTLLASTGLRNTLIILAVGGVLFAAYKAVRGVSGFMERMIANRDEMLRQLTLDMKAMDVRRQELELKHAEVLSKISFNAEAQLVEARDTRKEMHQRFNRASEEHTEMKERLSEIRGAVS